MRRRDFITLVGSAAAAWPLTARAQQPERMRFVGVLTGYGEGDLTARAEIAAFRERLARLGWVEGRNLRIDLRFGNSDADRISAHATELAHLAPDVIVAQTVLAIQAVQQQTRTIPIVIAGAGDVIANDIVTNLGHPEGNITGVTNSFASIGGKWLELLKEAAPAVKESHLSCPRQAGAREPTCLRSSRRPGARQLR